MQIDADGKVAVHDKSTGREVRMWPVDAREALAVGSHSLSAVQAVGQAAPTEGDPKAKREQELVALNAEQVKALAKKLGLPYTNKTAAVAAILEAEFSIAPKGWAAKESLAAFLDQPEDKIVADVLAWINGEEAFLVGQADRSPAGAQLAAEVAGAAEVARGGARENVVTALKEAAEIFAARAAL